MVWLYNCFYKNFLIFSKLTHAGGRFMSFFLWIFVFLTFFLTINTFSNFLGFLPSIFNEFTVNIFKWVLVEDVNVFSFEFVNQILLSLTIFIKNLYFVSINSFVESGGFFFTNYLDYPIFLYFGLFFFFLQPLWV